MFGFKRRHKEILEKLDKLEYNQRNNYHIINSEIACLEQEIQNLKAYIEKLNLSDALQYIEETHQNMDFLADIFENAIIESEQPNNEQ